ncbi:hypothetical protein P0O24_04360 [Methanotrichaceae archaeon M04Ac]|jgi:hypothetical protein|uniref:Uncharacterized protein n=1 Tax=Candidatus Methanocrinis alkalitolerans TaxID=3033395 RepID=A0ABT5XDP3_9EURY|nr:hypothetical protein [Candidatus Methanocrinis alkalitolerans]MCR3883347.1 hypothetical protein [Methanothrix sp.]MDF0592811.1 hypothetical protein [Candidatus Methanocrinis alkalitolerans]
MELEEEGRGERRDELAGEEPAGDEAAEEDLYEVDEDEISREMEALGARKRSHRRQEIEAALKAARERGDAGEGALILLNLDGGECLSFDGYPEALEYMGRHKGRWYLAPRGIDRRITGSHRDAPEG